MALLRISGSIGKKSTFTFLRLKTLKLCTAHTVHFKSWHFLHLLSLLHYTYFSWLFFHPRKAVYARRYRRWVTTTNQYFGLVAVWGGTAWGSCNAHVIENLPASNQVPSCQHSIATFLIFCVSTNLYVWPCFLSNVAGCYSFIWCRFMQARFSWPYSQEPVSGPCSETWIQSTTPYPLFATNINVCLPPTNRSHKGFPTNTFSFLPFTLHVLYIILLDFIIQLICVDVYKLLNSLFASVRSHFPFSKVQSFC